MANAPVNFPLDQLGDATLTDFVPAVAALPYSIGRRQHALATAFGYPPTWIDGNIGPKTNHVVRIVVPPNVTEARIWVLATQTTGGAGDITIASSSGGDSVTVQTSTAVDTQWAAQPVPSDELTIGSGAAWAPALEDLTITTDTNGATKVWGIGVEYIHRAQ